MAIRKLLRRVTATAAVGTSIAVAGVFRFSQPKTLSEKISTYHRKWARHHHHRQNKQDEESRSEHTEQPEDLEQSEGRGQQEHDKQPADGEQPDNGEQPEDAGQPEQCLDIQQTSAVGSEHPDQDINVIEGQAIDDECLNDDDVTKYHDGDNNVEEDTEDDESVNSLEAFDEVIQHLNLGKLQQAAAMVRMRQITNADIDPTPLEELLESCCEIQAVPKYGSYNLAYEITFQDNTQWIARVPGHGYNGRWSHLDQDQMESEYRTMEYIRARTSIPMPQVYYWNATCDYAGAPFALMSLVEGQNLSSLWPSGLSEDTRLDILSSIAGYMSQLYNLSFESQGRLVFHDSDDIEVAEKICLESSNLSCWSHTKAVGPYTTFMQSLWDIYDDDEDMHARCRAEIPILRRALKSIPDYLVRPQQFALNFADFNYQNILVDSEYRITGFIDWDGVGTESVSAGCARYPSWITRDWDPSMYGYDENTPVDDNPAHEESPEVLLKYRRHYAAEFAKHASRFEGYDPRMTSMSQMVEAIRLAAWDPICRSEILWKLIEYAFDDDPPFTLFEYVNDWIAGSRKEKDILIEAAFSKMWCNEWERAEPRIDLNAALRDEESDDGSEDSDISSERHNETTIASESSVSDMDTSSVETVKFVRDSANDGNKTEEEMWDKGVSETEHEAESEEEDEGDEEKKEKEQSAPVADRECTDYDDDAMSLCALQHYNTMDDSKPDSDNESRTRKSAGKTSSTPIHEIFARSEDQGSYIEVRTDLWGRREGLPTYRASDANLNVPLSSRSLGKTIKV